MRLGELNRRGPALVSGDTPHPLKAPEVARLQAGGAEVVDVRPVVDFAAGHVPGSLSIPLRPVFATWLGWLVPADRPLVIVRNADQDPAEIVWQARKIGYDQIAGELNEGLASWAAAGETIASIPLVTSEGLGGARVLDIRQDSEFASGHVPGAHHIELGEVLTRVDDLPPGPMVVMCGHGERAMTAASLLTRAGLRDVAVLDGGPESWAEATGKPLEVAK